MRELAIRTILTALILTIATLAGAECGNLCDHYWWKTATTADVQAELDDCADVMDRNKYGATPLHFATVLRTPTHTQALLDAGANVMEWKQVGWKPLHVAVHSGMAVNIQLLLELG